MTPTAKEVAFDCLTAELLMLMHLADSAHLDWLAAIEAAACQLAEDNAQIAQERALRACRGTTRAPVLVLPVEVRP